jgi:acetyl-CoA C-acetyltransferase
MAERTAIVGAGYTPLRALSSHASFRELVFEAAVRAYQDAGITPADIDSVVALGEDYREGTCISDEYVPDQLGAVQKPVHTVTGDGVQGLGMAWMLLQSGVADIVVLEGHSKASNIRHPAHVEAMALDPVFVRGHAWNPLFVAGLEMQRFLHETGITPQQAAQVVVKNKRNALRNPIAAYPGQITVEQVLKSQPWADPLTELAVAPPADGAFVFVVANAAGCKRCRGQPVFIDGIAWNSDTPNLATRDWTRATYIEKAAARAYEMAALQNPAADLSFIEADDAYSYKELQHLEALQLIPKGQSGQWLQDGHFDLGGKLPVNPSGGALGCGNLHDASALRAILEAVWQLRGQAGERQIPNARRGLVCSWRGVPTATGGVAILSGR